MNNKKITIIVIALIAILGLSAYFLISKKANDVNTNIVKVDSFDPKNATYTIDGTKVTLVNGLSEIEAAPGSASKIVTKYFGNEVKGDIDGDGTTDVVFLMTQNTGGTGTFYYVSALLNKNGVPVSIAPVLLGDRIAPQTTSFTNGKVLVNYADRNIGESFDVSPSLGKTMILKFDANSMQFATVESNFEGEADTKRMSLDMKKWNWVSTNYNNDKIVTPNKVGVFTMTFTKDNRFSATTDCNTINGEYKIERDGIKFDKTISTLMYCDGSQESVFQKMLNETQNYMFTSKGELVLLLKMDTGSVIFN